MPVPELLIDELNASVAELRGSLTELLGRLQLDVERPQKLSRALGVDKMLAWKVSKIIRSTEAEAVKHLPGSAALEMLLTAVQKTGAAEGSLDRARLAIQSVQNVVQRHVGDRPTLDLIMDGMSARSSDHLMLSRKLAFRGNSGIWGVQARVRLNTAIVAPSADAPDMLDAATIGGWVDFRRLRAESRWALFRHRQYGAAEASVPRREPIDPSSVGGPPLLREFCSSSLPPIQSIDDANGETVYELGPSPVGNTGAFSCVLATIARQIGPRHADAADDVGEFGALVSAPAETLIFDVLVHRSCEFAIDTRARVFGTLSSGPAGRHERDVLSLSLAPTNLGRFPPAIENPAVPAYGAIIDRVTSHCGWSIADFAAVRYVLEFPPFPSTVVVSFPLECR